MEIIDPGHHYLIEDLYGGYQHLFFLKRSGGAVKYNDDHNGTQTQEILRALIDRTKFLNDQIECNESGNSIWHLRMVLYEYEARAYRRKLDKANREDRDHHDDAKPRLWRNGIYDDVPFTEDFIEERPTDSDGHVISPSLRADYVRLEEDLEIPRHRLEVGDWYCPDSLFHKCIYDEEDPLNDMCLYCGLPDERK